MNIIFFFGLIILACVGVYLYNKWITKQIYGKDPGKASNEPPAQVLGYSTENPYIVIYPTLKHLADNCRIFNVNELSFYRHYTDDHVENINIRELAEFVEQEQLTEDHVQNLIKYAKDNIQENANGIYTGMINCSNIEVSGCRTAYYPMNISSLPEKCSIFFGIDISDLGFNQRKYLFDKINNLPYKWKTNADNTLVQTTLVEPVFPKPQRIMG